MSPGLAQSIQHLIGGRPSVRWLTGMGSQRPESSVHNLYSLTLFDSDDSGLGEFRSLPRCMKF